MINLHDLNLDEITEIVCSLNEKKFRAKQLFDGLVSYKNLNEMSNLSQNFKDEIAKSYNAVPLTIDKKFVSTDGTIKYLFKLSDNNLIEGVLMSYKHGNTICISTQVGCRMGCVFCASTKGGLIRNLTAGEMLAQVLCVNRDIGGDNKNRKITNVVLMGSGEPLDNYDNVVKFLRNISDENSINISGRNISLSTCGLVEKMYALAEEKLQITLTISLHAPNDEIRKQTMPIANKHSIFHVIKAARHYFNKTKRRVVFEYTLIENVNDKLEHADLLSKLLAGLSCHVNLITLNEIKEIKLVKTNKKRAYAFMDRLEKKGISATVRRTMGEDIDGACGQLRAKFI